MRTIIEDWGLIPYAEARQRQMDCFDAIVKAKGTGGEYINRICFCEHPHVYTLGHSGKETNMLLSPERLSALGIELVHVERGGDITYHGPGQQVCYPILNLQDYGLGLKNYINLLEQAVIELCSVYKIKAGRVNGMTGVWIDSQMPSARKICAIGVRCSHYVTMHGLALNVNTNLQYFNYINPCGIIGKGVTSLAKEIGRYIDIDEVKTRLTDELCALLVDCQKTGL